MILGQAPGNEIDIEDLRSRYLVMVSESAPGCDRSTVVLEGAIVSIKWITDCCGCGKEKAMSEKGALSYRKRHD